ncbi:hypothetical protein [Thalassotalea sp. PP2-459]|uniref:hypothetical protein n=1 Tax=Thalassotalea sp. PP2-459 TaxID=1742724 RepID=UPI000943576A|nr:hypothetical protein [Thalassotalea sp. PP2-459]OKY26914.1 hypothetical protein BI291_11060 [Thalassotalea sp. PP2-459]
MKNTEQTAHSIEQLEQYEKNKFFVLKGLILSFIGWQLGQIMGDHFTDILHPYVLFVFQLINLLGALAWVGFILYFIKIGRFLKNNLALNHQINDERTKLIRLRAMSYGLVITLGTTALLFGASILFDAFAQNFALSGTLVARSVLLVAVASTLISYLLLEKDA